jgi:type IV secretory pathway VirB2 component (pilin)
MTLIRNKQIYSYLALVLLMGLFLSPDVQASVESTLSTMQSRLTGSVLPLVAILGFLYAGFSFVVGSPNARRHLMLAIVGAVVGFGANSILNFIRSMVQ